MRPTWVFDPLRDELQSGSGSLLIWNSSSPCLPVAHPLAWLLHYRFDAVERTRQPSTLTTLVVVDLLRLGKLLPLLAQALVHWLLGFSSVVNSSNVKDGEAVALSHSSFCSMLSSGTHCSSCRPFQLRGQSFWAVWRLTSAPLVAIACLQVILNPSQFYRYCTVGCKCGARQPRRVKRWTTGAQLSHWKSFIWRLPVDVRIM